MVYANLSPHIVNDINLTISSISRQSSWTTLASLLFIDEAHALDHTQATTKQRVFSLVLGKHVNTQIKYE